MKREKILEKKIERESRERKFLYLSDEAIMIEITTDHIKVTQYGLTMIDVINFKKRPDRDPIYCMNFGAISGHHIFISILF